MVYISSWIYLFLAPALLTLWSKLLSSEHLQKSSSEDGKPHSQGLCLTCLCGDPMTTGFNCCVSLELLPLPLTSVAKLLAFLSHAKLAVNCNMSLQRVVQTKLSSVVCWVAHRTLCGLLGNLCPSYMSHQCPLQCTVVIEFLETILFHITAVPRVLETDPQGLDVQNTGERTYSLTSCLNLGVCICVYASPSFCDDSKWICNPISKLGVFFMFLGFFWKVFL